MDVRFVGILLNVIPTLKPILLFQQALQQVVYILTDTEPIYEIKICSAIL